MKMYGMRFPPVRTPRLNILRVLGLYIRLGRYTLGNTAGIRVSKVYTASEVAVSVPDLP